jgi:hypothetical protein
MWLFPRLSASAKRRYSFPGNASFFLCLARRGVGAPESEAAVGSVDLAGGMAASSARLRNGDRSGGV